MLAVLSIAAAGRAYAQQPGSAEPPTSSFTVFVRSVPIGSEQISVTRDAAGWLINSASRLGAPIDVVARRLQVRYTPDWKPLELSIDGSIKGQLEVLRTTVTGTTATSLITIGTQTRQKVDTIAADAVLLPNPFFAPYEALAARLKDVAPGATLQAYGAPQASFEIRVGESDAEQIQTPAAIVSMRHTHLTLMTPGVPLDLDLWSDLDGRLLRLSVPAQNLEVVREDIASVSARRLTVSRPNDEQVRIPANGFSLAATVSKPFDVPKQAMPAIVLVGGSGQTDRDEIVFNIPIFGQLSTALADAGFLVIRYDKRGVGQSGGRLESATLADLAEDLRSAVKFAASRKDVNQKRITVVGHSEGGAVALLAAAKDKQIAAVVLMAAPGIRGSDLILEQQQHLLERSSMSDAERQAKVELQKKINAAVLSGTGWEGIPPDVRRQVETPWFQSLLAFDPAKVMREVRQPILIVQGELDTQVVPANADSLLALSHGRKNSPPSDIVKIPGVNHLFVAATTGEVDEYGSLKEKHITTELASAIASWLQKTLR